MKAKSTLSMVTVAAVAAALLTMATPVREAAAWNPIASCGPVWDLRGGPNGWYINDAGYSQVDMPTLERVMIESMDEWSRPCCSNWRATYIGLTDGNPLNNNDRRHIVGFEENQWPQQLGNPNFTLAVTLPAYTNTCVLVSADMLFNAARHTFTTTGRGTDLGAIATHEFGHWLGLDHSSVRTATMFESYVGGTSQRTLDPDDIEGVCSLYPGSCSCTSNADCTFPGEECVEGTCSIPPCQSNADCDGGQECNTTTGECFTPPCQSDADCAGNQVCDNGTCRRPRGDCQVCQPCSSNAECGGSGICSPLVQGGDSVCIVLCGTDGLCPGDSECFQIPQQNVSICLNADVNQRGPCPSDYICGTDDFCAGVTCGGGEVCDPRTGACVQPGGGADGCDICAPCGSDSDCQGGTCSFFQGQAGGVCSQSCTDDASCPGQSACFPVQGPQGVINLCLNPDAQRGICPSSFECEAGGAEVCPPGTTRNPTTGACEAPHGGCAICEPCSSDASCGPQGRCLLLNNDARCTTICESNSDCPADAQCYELGGGQKYCLNPGANEAICPSTWSCDLEVDGPSPEAPGQDPSVSFCPICDTCSTDSDCGSGARCLSVDGANVCTQSCSEEILCPGDSACYNLGGAVGQICLNPGAEAGICPADYRCTLASAPLDDDDGFGCDGCAATRGTSGASMMLLVLVGLVLVRRRRFFSSAA